MQPAIPNELPIRELDWTALIPLIGAARGAVGHYNGVLSTLRNPEILLAPLTMQEAVLSSRIEGTQATLQEVLRFDAGEKPERSSLRLDFQEIVNYRRALREAVVELRDRPFSLNLLRQMHATLLDSVRRQDKARGEFRRDQNWVGSPGTPLEDADFVPPPAEKLTPYLSAWEAYYHSDAPDALVQLALVHAQFEFLHPFLDGNGRLGRILIPLFIFERNLLSWPAFYLSSYLERHRDSYIAGLRDLGHKRGAWRAWCEFFLTAIAAQAEENTRQIGKIHALYEGMKARVIAITHSQFAILLLDAIFEHPVFNTSQFARMPNMPSRPMLIALLRRLADAGVLRVILEGSGRRPQIMVCPELMTLCEERG